MRKVSQRQKNLDEWLKIKEKIESGEFRFIWIAYNQIDEKTDDCIHSEVQKERERLGSTYAVWNTDPFDGMIKRFAFINRMIAKYQPRKKVVK